MSTSRESYQLGTSLRWLQPPVWRRLLVRPDISLAELHDIIQVAMGWTDSHLRQFYGRDVRYGVPDPDFSPDVRDSRKIKLGDLIKKPKARLIYEYDFGDGWEHEIVLEKCVEAEPSAKYPFVVEGERACPPEDCGGVGGYLNLLEAVVDPDYPDHEHLTEWLGKEFDPEAFDVEATNKVFHGGW